MGATETEIDERNAKRDERVLTAALTIVTTQGLSALTRESIACEAGLAPASVSNFGRHRISNGAHDREGYRSRILSAMMAWAIEKEDLSLLRIGLADGCLKLDAVPVAMRVALTRG